MDDELFKKMIANMQDKAKVMQGMHEEAKKTAKNALDAHSFESQRTGAMLAIAQALNVHNEFQLAGIEEQLKVVLEAMQDE